MAGGGGVEMVIEDLDDPDELRNELRTRMAQAGERTRAREGTGALDAEAVQRLVDEARKMRETAEAIDRHLQ